MSALVLSMSALGLTGGDPYTIWLTTSGLQEQHSATRIIKQNFLLDALSGVIGQG